MGMKREKRRTKSEEKRNQLRSLWESEESRTGGDGGLVEVERETRGLQLE